MAVSTSANKPQNYLVTTATSLEWP